MEILLVIEKLTKFIINWRKWAVSC